MTPNANAVCGLSFSACLSNDLGSLDKRPASCKGSEITIAKTFYEIF
jgi:hypothetical protein